MKKKSIAALLVGTLMTFTVLAAVSLVAYAVGINYVDNAPDIAQTPIIGQMIDPSGYYNTDLSPDAKTAGNALDNRRVWIWDFSYIQGQPDNPFMMLKWDMGFATNFVRIYPDIENGFQADGHDYLEWSLWGSNNPGENSASWTLLWDPIASAGNNVNDLVVTQVAGTAVSATIYRQTNPGVGTVPASGFGDAFTIDFVVPQSYQFFGIRASTKDTASWDPDPEINAVATRTPMIPVYFDIKPGSWPNPLNLVSRGVLPVAICGTADFDVTTINVTTIKLTREGLDDGVSPIRWDYEDVATPWTGEPGGGHALGGDGYLDLTLKFSTQEVCTTLGLDAFLGQKIPLIITGNLNAAADGTHIKGQDYVWILELHGDANDDLVVNIFDGSVISAHWYPGPPSGPLGYDAFYDISGDGTIDVIDAAQVSSNWGRYWQP
jgi:hypothetical protein